MKNDKLIIEGKTWTLKQLAQEEINVQNENNRKSGMDLEFMESDDDNTIISNNGRAGSTKRSHSEVSPEMFGAMTKNTSTPVTKKGKIGIVGNNKETTQRNLQDMWNLPTDNKQRSENQNVVCEDKTSEKEQK